MNTDLGEWQSQGTHKFSHCGCLQWANTKPSHQCLKWILEGLMGPCLPFLAKVLCTDGFLEWDSHGAGPSTKVLLGNLLPEDYLL